MDVRDYIDSNAREFFGQLKAWLAIPSISADPGHHGDVRSSAQWLAAHLTATGFPTVEIWDTGAGQLPRPAGRVRALASPGPGRARPSWSTVTTTSSPWSPSATSSFRQ